MIGVDTNILLRYSLDDDRQQSPIATRFVDDAVVRGEPLLINPVVLVEFVWTLRAKMKFTKEHILSLLDVIQHSSAVTFTEPDVIPAAIESWRNGKADFPDYLIRELNLAAGAETTCTFDTDAAQDHGFTLLR